MATSRKTHEDDSSSGLDDTESEDRKIECLIPKNVKDRLLAHARHEGFRSIAPWLRTHLVDFDRRKLQE